MRLETGQSTNVILRLQDYGKMPNVRRQVKLTDMSPRTSWNEKYLEFTANQVWTDEHGIATFKATAKEVGQPRGGVNMDRVVAICVSLLC